MVLVFLTQMTNSRKIFPHTRYFFTYCEEIILIEKHRIVRVNYSLPTVIYVGSKTATIILVPDDRQKIRQFKNSVRS